MKIAVFGYGFIGKNIVSKFSRKNNDIVVFSRNLNPALKETNVSYFSIDFRMKDFNLSKIDGFDVAIYAVNVGIPGNNDVQNNHDELDIFIKVVKQCIKAKVKKIVLISSASVYGDSFEDPLKEEDELEGSSEYAQTRIKMEQFLKKEFDNDQNKFLIIRPSNPYGPYQFKQGIIYRILSSKSEKNMVKIDNSAKSIRDFIFIEDLVDGLEFLISQQHSFHTYNLSSSMGISILELLQKIELMEIGFQEYIEINFKQYSKSVSILSNSRLLSEMKNLQLHSLDEGLKKTLNWINSREVD
jgi:UDP-glucose 4-epimerase